MDLQSRKLNLISFLLGLKDEEFFKQLEEYILKNQPEGNDPDFLPFTKGELIERAKTSKEDYLNGRYTTQEKVEKLSDKW